MKIGIRKVLPLPLVCISISLYAPTALAGSNRPVDTEAQKPSVEVQLLNALKFGAFVPDNAGTIVIDPDGNRVSSGGVILLSNRPGQEGQCAVTTYSGKNSYVSPPAILFPTSASLTNSTPGIGGTMVMSAFTSKLTPPRWLYGNKQYHLLKVGCTLQVQQNQPAGNYQGEIPITIIHE